MAQKINNPDYQLSEILAMEYQKTLGTGANKPLVISGVDLKTKIRQDFVLKYRGAERMDEAACGRELLTSFLASELDIHTPKPAVIRVTENFLSTNSVKNHPEFGKIIKSKGINFGSLYQKGNLPIEQLQVLSPIQKEQAARIFFFDILLKNSDRRKEKPNMFVVNENIYAIDHELPYGFLATLSFLMPDNPWELNDTDVNAGKNHFFYPLLHGKKNIDYETVTQPFVTINETFWTKAYSLLPESWMSDSDFQRTKKHFTDIQSNFETFKSEIWNKILMA